MKIVTGVGENAHVTSKEFRRVIESMAGQGSFIIKCGDNMATVLVSNNLLKIKSGAMIHHGNISSVDPYDEIEINNGTQGMKRIDLIVNRYTKNAETEIESNEWVVIQGTPATSNPEVPAYIVGNLQDGDLVDDCPFCQIVIDGINVTEVKELLTIMSSIPELNSKTDGLGNFYINTPSTDVSLPTGEAIAVCQLTLPKGIYMLTGNVRFSANANGYRSANFNNNKGNTNLQIKQMAASQSFTQLNLAFVYEAAEERTVYLNAYQNSGTSLVSAPAGTFMRAVKIG